jgi:hypothetical protein
MNALKIQSRFNYRGGKKRRILKFSEDRRSLLGYKLTNDKEKELMAFFL